MRRALAATLTPLCVALASACGAPPPAEAPAPPPVASAAPARAAASAAPADSPPPAPPPAPAPDASPAARAQGPDAEISAFVLDVLTNGVRVPHVPRSGPLWEQATRAAQTAKEAARIREVVESPGFAALYRAHRDEQARGGDSPRARTSKELQDEAISGHERSLAEVTRAMADPAFDPAHREAFTTMRAAVERALADAKAHPERFDELARLEADEARLRARDEQAKRAAALGRLPEDPRLLVRARLQDYLRETRDVAFDARTATVAGRQRFTDPKLEAKSPVWKAAFRAGRPAVTAARAFAQAWLADLNRAGVSPAKAP